MSFYSQVVAVSTRRETKADIVAYYQENFPARGKGSWRQQLQNTLELMTGMKPTTIKKRFDPQRLHNPEPKNAEQYRELGKMLPPMAPEGGYHIYGWIYVKYSNDCVDRYIDVKITGAGARVLANTSADAMLQAAINQYQNDDVDDDDGSPGQSDCGPPELIVEAIE